MTDLSRRLLATAGLRLAGLGLLRPARAQEAVTLPRIAAPTEPDP